MSDTSHGTGGLTFDKTKKSWPSELNVLLALIIIIVIFEFLGQVLPYMNDQSFLFDTKDRFDSIFNEARLKIIILQVAIIGIIAIEAGLLTPPFGLLVYTVKAAIHGEGDNVQVMSIFKSSTPYWMIMLVCMVAIIVFPEIATYLPDILF